MKIKLKKHWKQLMCSHDYRERDYLKSVPVSYSRIFRMEGIYRSVCLKCNKEIQTIGDPISPLTVPPQLPGGKTRDYHLRNLTAVQEEILKTKAYLEELFNRRTKEHHHALESKIDGERRQLVTYEMWEAYYEEVEYK